MKLISFSLFFVENKVEMSWRLLESFTFTVAVVVISCNAEKRPVRQVISGNGIVGTSWGNLRSNMVVNCNNGQCQMCLNNKCYNSQAGSFAKSFMRSGCPPAFTYANCGWVQTGKQCLMGKCKGFGTQEPCYNQSDCSQTARACQDSLCRYAEPTGPEVFTCTFTNHCQSNEDCINGICQAGSALEYLGGQTCTFDRDCPGTYSCDSSQLTCFKGGKKHIRGITCIFNHQCPSGHYCDKTQLTCYEGGPAHSQRSCVFTSQCDQGQTCRDMTCTAN